jgi:hypothetical protein
MTISWIISFSRITGEALGGDTCISKVVLSTSGLPSMAMTPFSDHATFWSTLWKVGLPPAGMFRLTG